MFFVCLFIKHLLFFNVFYQQHLILLHPEIKVFFFIKSLSQKHAKPNEFNEDQMNLYVCLPNICVVFTVFLKKHICPPEHKGFLFQKTAASEAREAQHHNPNFRNEQHNTKKQTYTITSKTSHSKNNFFQLFGKNYHSRFFDTTFIFVFHFLIKEKTTTKE